MDLPDSPSGNFTCTLLGQITLAPYQIQMKLPDFYSGEAIRDEIREPPEASSLSGLATESRCLASSSVAKVIFKHCGLLAYLHRIYFSELIIFTFDIEENICMNNYFKYFYAIPKFNHRTLRVFT